jgi:glucuronate isomerase
MIGTTDDPADSLDHYAAIAADPSFARHRSAISCS